MRQQDRKFIGRAQSAQDVVVVGADGSVLRDGRGRTFIDFTSGWCVGNLGWNHPEIRARMQRYRGPDYVAPTIPTPEFMLGAVEMCRQYGTLFVADEVATGFGRTGTVFACDHYGLEPDILCVAKALTNGAAPMAATITTAAFAEVVDDLDVYATFGWQPK